MKQFYLTKKINEIVSTILILLGLKEESIGLATTPTSRSLINFDTRNPFGLYSFKAALVFLFVFVGIGNSVWGQNASTYGFAASSGTYTALTSPTSVTVSSADDGYYNGIPIGFNFVMGGTTYTYAHVSSNGWFTLGTSASNNALSSSTAANDFTTLGASPTIAPLWDDLALMATTGISYLTSGTAPNRTFTIQYSNEKWYYAASAASMSFQVVLSEGTNTVKFIYSSLAGATSSPSASIGIATANSNYLSVGTTVTTSATASNSTNTTGIATKPASGITFTFTPPPACTTPTGLAASATASGTSATGISGSFTATSGTAPTGYIVVRSTSATPPATLAAGTTLPTVGSTTAFTGTTYVEYVGTAAGSWTSASLSANTSYYYYVFSYNSGSCSTSYSASATASTATTTCLAASTTSAATSVSSGAFTANWSTVTGATGYTFELATDSGFTQNYSSTATGTTAITRSLTGLTKGLTYYYRVTATGTSCSSVVSNVTSQYLSDPLHGTYTINSGAATTSPMVHDGTGNFASFTAAINSLNSNGISAGVTFNVTAGLTFSELTPIITATGTSVNTITFQKSGSGNNPKITPTGVGATDAGLTIGGGDYFTFDGIDIDGSAATSTTNAIEYGYYVRNASATDGAQNNTIKNCAITLNKAFAQSAAVTACIYSNTATTASNATGANSNNNYYNLTLSNAQNGVYLLGSSAFPDLANNVGVSGSGCQTTRTIISNIGGTVSGLANGVFSSGQSGTNIFNCDISNIKVSAAANTVAGILLGTFAGTASIYNNKVSDVANTNTGATGRASGIEIQNSTGTPNDRVYNNYVYNIFSGNTTNADTVRAYGIYCNNTTTATVSDIDNNNVYLSVASGTPAYSSTCFAIANSSTAVQKVRGNIFVNAFPAQTTAKHTCWTSTANAAIGGTGSVSNFNDMYVTSDVGTSGFVGRGNSVNYNTVATWATAYTQDANSQSVDPVFASSTNLATGNTALNAVSGFTPQSWVTTDIACTDRSTKTPSDIGAFAFDPPANPNITSFSPTDICQQGGQTVTITGTNFSGIASVKFNGVSATTFAVNSTTQITVTVPSGITDGQITVTNVTPVTATSPQSYVARATPIAPTVSGGGTACTSATLTATNTGDISEGNYPSYTAASIYFEGTSSSSVATTTLFGASQSVSVNGTYYARSISSYGCTSAAGASAAVTISTPIVITNTVATPAAKCIGATATALTTVTTTGTSPSYQWYLVGTPDAAVTTGTGGTTATYTPSTATAGTFNYYCKVTSPTPCSSSVNSNTVAVVINPLPVISGATSLCTTKTITLSGSGTPASSTPWVSSAIGVATITSSGVVSTVATGSTNITYTDNNGCASANYPVTVLASPTGVTATSATSTICNGGTFILNSTPSAQTGSTLFSETFETTPFSQWTTLGTGVTAAQNATYYSQGSKSILLTYAASADGSYATTNNVNLAGAVSPTLTFSHILATESALDYGYVQYSTDGGTTWTSFPTTSYTGSATLKNSVVSFDKTSYTDWSNVFTSSSVVSPGTAPATSMWKNESINLSAYTSSTQFRIRFRITSDISVQYVGWFIDNVALTTQNVFTYTYNWASNPIGFTSTVQNPTGVTASNSGSSATNTDYTVTVTGSNGCAVTATKTVAVNPSPTITGTTTLCIGATSQLTGSGSPATTNAWASSTPSVASVSSTGLVTALTSGTTNITYTDNNGCSKVVPVTVNALPTITGASTVCVGGTSSLSGSGTAASSNAWAADTSGFVTISTNGTVSGVSAGSTVITYTNNNGCSTTKTITAQNVASTPAITTSPINAGSFALNGTSAEADGSIVSIYKNATLAGTATVASGTWSYTFTSALTGGDVITASVAATGKCTSALSTGVTVLSYTATPVVSAPLCQGATTVSGTSTEADGTTISVFVNATLNGTTTVSSNAWSYTLTAALNGGDVVTATAATSGKTLSLLSSGVTTFYSLTGLSYASATNSYPVNNAITANTATASPSGAGAIAYTVSPSLPSGLGLNGTTGAITGTPTATSSATTYTITATSACNAVTTDISIEVTDGVSALSYTTPVVYCDGTAITDNVATITGTPTGYAISPALPSGLSLDTTTGTISGTPSGPSDTTVYTVTATSATNSVTFAITLSVNGALSGLSYASATPTYCTGVAITPNTKTITGNGTISYTVSPSLPLGFSLNGTTGTISGTPTTETAAADYTVTATNGCFSTTALNAEPLSPTYNCDV